MIHERRVYQCVPGKLQKVLARFENDVLPIWHKHGYRPLGFWTPIFGENGNQVHYMLEWADMEDRNRKIAAFGSDPEWQKAKERSEPDGQPLVESVTSYLLNPCSFLKRNG